MAESDEVRTPRVADIPGAHVVLRGGDAPRVEAAAAGAALGVRGIGRVAIAAIGAEDGAGGGHGVGSLRSRGTRRAGYGGASAAHGTLRIMPRPVPTLPPDEMHAPPSRTACRSACPPGKAPTASAIATTLVATLLALGAGCASSGGRAAAAGRPLAGEPDAPAGSDSPATLAAMVDGDALSSDAVRRGAYEMAGATALREAVLDARLARRLARDRARVDDAMVERERTLLLESLSPDGARALELLGEIRTRQGLGPVRFEALLRRNAGLRALVARAVEIDEAGVAAIFDMRHGPRRVARVAVLANLADAERLRADAAAGRTFADLAFERSLDATAPRGGLLEPVARRDPSYPEALRAAIWSTAVGEVSPAALDGGRVFVVEVLEERAADGVLPEADRGECERLLRLSRERLLMEALARELSSLEGVTIFDRALDGAVRGG